MENKIASINFLTMARMPFLSAREKIKLALALDKKDLYSLTIADAEMLLGHRIITKKRNPVWDVREWENLAKKDLDYLQKTGSQAFSYFDEDYPSVLRETSRPPFMLYVKGSLPKQDVPSLAIVGTRYPSGKGLEAAFTLASQAASMGIAVISGLARGIDAAAHKGALSVKTANRGHTFAVLGRGIDGVYPVGNKDLAAAIIQNGGGLISEYPPGIEPTRWTFPERNRILVGLCRSTIVVEAPEKSGALISSSFALEEGRDVYVSLSASNTQRSRGSDALVEDGAKAIKHIDEILADWSYKP